MATNEKMTLIDELVPGSKSTMMLTVLGVDQFPYSGGIRSVITMCDASGKEVSAVGFHDVHDVCNKLCVGHTYVVTNVMCEMRYDALQLKIQASVTIQPSEVSLPFGTKIADLPLSGSATVMGVVSQFDDQPLKSRNGDTYYKFTMSDETGSVEVLAFKEAAEVLEPGTVIAVRGKLGSGGAFLIFSRITKDVTNDSLSEFWNANKEKGDFPSKRAKVDDVLKLSLGIITSDDIGSRVRLNAIVCDTSIGATQTATGTKKRVLKVVDQSNAKMELAVFGEKAAATYEVGQAITCVATVSSWNHLSLTTNGTDAPSVDDSDALRKWWETTGQTVEFDNVSTETLPEVTTIEKVLGMDSGARVAVAGQFYGNFVRDVTGSIRVAVHGSFKDADLSNYTDIHIQDALLKKDKDESILYLFRNSIRRKSGNSDM